MGGAFVWDALVATRNRFPLESTAHRSRDGIRNVSCSTMSFSRTTVRSTPVRKLRSPELKGTTTKLLSSLHRETRQLLKRLRASKRMFGPRVQRPQPQMLGAVLFLRD